MKLSDLIPSLFIGGPVGLILAGGLAQLMPAGLAVFCGIAAGEVFGMLVIRGIRRPAA